MKLDSLLGGGGMDWAEKSPQNKKWSRKLDFLASNWCAPVISSFETYMDISAFRIFLPHQVSQLISVVHIHKISLKPFLVNFNPCPKACTVF